jgi:response regulator RpfG family c-di-GMP phosphodiesterase
MAITDVYDTHTSQRPFPNKKTSDIIKKEKSVKFEPEPVDVFYRFKNSSRRFISPPSFKQSPKTTIGSTVNATAPHQCM